LDQVVAHVQANPECLREKDAETGRLVLHDALADYYVSLDKIQYLIITYPQSVYEKDAEGFMPLHVASAALKVRLDVFRYLLTAGPLAVEVEVSNGHRPLYLAIKSKVFDKAEILLEQSVGNFNVTSNRSEPPLLHLAIRC
jgi:hypothetical protein